MWRLSELSPLTRNLLVSQALISGIGPHLDVRSPYLLGRNSPKCLEEQREKVSEGSATQLYGVETVPIGLFGEDTFSQYRRKSG
jgi:hypothetical protein